MTLANALGTDRGLTSALVTGGSGALGAAIAAELSRLGHSVAVHYSSREDRASEAVGRLAQPAIAVRADLSVWEEVRRMEEIVREELGDVTVLVNCAGIRRDGLLAGQSASEWRRVIDVNLIGTFNVIRAVVPRMLKNRFGRIVNVVSPAGLVGSPGQTAYSASKAGIVGLTRSLAHETGRRNVTVNALSPGFMETDMTAGVSAEWQQELVARTPLRRVTTPEEVAAALALLLDIGYVTGQVFSIDGGLTA